MAERKAIPKKTRFEVLKRDKFTHTCSGKVNEDGEFIGYISIKEAETCDSFEVKQK